MNVAVKLLGAVLVGALPFTTFAQECATELGTGWPAGMANYGQVTVDLLGGDHLQGLSVVTLPKRGEERQLILAPSQEGGWQVISGVADKRIHHVAIDRTGFGVHLRMDQEPHIDRAPLPADLGQRIVAHWERVLQPAQVVNAPPYMDREDVTSFQINGQRLSGRFPGCSSLTRLQDINALLLELAGSKEKKYEKRHEAIARALDKYEERLAEGKI